MESSTDTRPKFVHFLGKSLLQQRAKKSLFKGTYIELEDLIYIQSVMFEFCAFVGIRCDNSTHDFFRVLSTRQGLEEEGFVIAEQVFDAQIGSFIDDAIDPIDLVFRTVRSRTGVDCDLGEFLKLYGKQTLKTDQVGMDIIAWGIHGAVAGLQHFDEVDRLLKWKYATWQERGFSEEQAKLLKGGLGANPVSFKDAEDVAIKMFSEFCKEYYPVEARSFWFIDG
jgi:hypothetical protein